MRVNLNILMMNKKKQPTFIDPYDGYLLSPLNSSWLFNNINNVTIDFLIPI